MEAAKIVPSLLMQAVAIGLMPCLILIVYLELAVWRIIN
jgi:hypothetical protein